MTSSYNNYIVRSGESQKGNRKKSPTDLPCVLGYICEKSPLATAMGTIKTIDTRPQHMAAIAQSSGHVSMPEQKNSVCSLGQREQTSKNFHSRRGRATTLGNATGILVRYAERGRD